MGSYQCWRRLGSADPPNQFREIDVIYLSAYEAGGIGSREGLLVVYFPAAGNCGGTRIEHKYRTRLEWRVFHRMNHESRRLGSLVAEVCRCKSCHWLICRFHALSLAPRGENSQPMGDGPQLLSGIKVKLNGARGYHWPPRAPAKARCRSAVVYLSPACGGINARVDRGEAKDGR